jgi:hypothetical protein
MPGEVGPLVWHAAIFGSAQGALGAYRRNELEKLDKIGVYWAELAPSSP